MTVSYTHMGKEGPELVKELKEAAAAINTSVLPVEAEGKCDPFDNVKYLSLIHIVRKPMWVYLTDWY